MADASLSCPKNLQAEIVSPILNYQDIDKLQRIIRQVRKDTKAKMTKSTSCHVHIDGSKFDTKSIINLMKIINKQENIIYQALGVTESRKNSYAKPINQDFMNKIEQKKPKNLHQLNEAWYGYYNSNPRHYDNSRYVGINIHSYFQKHTIEMRFFNNPTNKTSLHAGRIRAWIVFSLALAAKALKARAACSKKREFNPESAKYDMRVFLISALKLNGNEYANVRKHLLANFSGSGAWKYGAPQRRIA